MTAENLKEVTDEQLEQDYNNLNSKQEKSEEESQQLETLKTERQTRYQRRIDEIKSEAKLSNYKYEQAQEEINELKQRINQLETAEPKEPVTVSKETIKVGDKTFYTDKTLSSMIKAGQISETEAYQHQQERIEEVAADKAYQRLKGEQSKNEDQRVRREDAQAVLREYPHFDKNNASFNPEDPLYKEATRIYQMGYYANPRGLSEAVKEAKRILRITDTRVDNTDNLTLKSPSAPESKKKEEIELSEYEKEMAIRQYTRGDVKNPKTGRPYTESEAIEHAKQAKKDRLEYRRAR